MILHGQNRRRWIVVQKEQGIFKLHSEYQPTGDQPQAIRELVEGFRKGNQFETLLGVTGSGKTFTMANVIAALNKPTLVIAHNKTLAGQLYGEFKEFFLKMQWSTLCPIMIIISRRRTFLLQIPISQRTHPSMMKLISCGYRQQPLCPSGGMWW